MSSSVDSRKKIQVRLSDEEFQIVQFWAKKEGVSVNQWMCDSILSFVRLRLGDYSIASLEHQRFNQIILALETLTSTFDEHSKRITKQFDALLNLTHGDGSSYLAESEDGKF